MNSKCFSLLALLLLLPSCNYPTLFFIGNQVRWEGTKTRHPDLDAEWRLAPVVDGKIEFENSSPVVLGQGQDRDLKKIGSPNQAVYLGEIHLTDRTLLLQQQEKGLSILFPAVMLLQRVEINGRSTDYSDAIFSQIGPIVPLSKEDLIRDTISIKVFFSPASRDTFVGMLYSGMRIGSTAELFEYRDRILWYQKSFAQIGVVLFLGLFIFLVTIRFTEKTSPLSKPLLNALILTAACWAAILTFLSGAVRETFPGTLGRFHYFCSALGYFSLVRLITVHRRTRLNLIMRRASTISIIAQFVLVWTGVAVFQYANILFQPLIIFVIAVVSIFKDERNEPFWKRSSLWILVNSIFLISDGLKLFSIYFAVNYPFPYSTRWIAIPVFFGLVVFFARTYSTSLAKSKIIESQLILARQIAHDIQSPLAALNSVSYLATELTSDLKEQLRQSISRIKAISDGLLQGTVYKIASTSVPSSNDIDVAASVRNVVDQVIREKQIEYRGKVQIHQKLGSTSDLFVWAPEENLRRSLSNLINNAIEASTPPVQIEVSVEQKSERILEISITDFGTGMDAATIAKLGAPGFTQGKTNGNGLGIHQIKDWVDHFEGALIYNSSPGKGTTATIRLQVCSPPPWHVGDIDLESYSKIVTLDDDETVNQTYSRLFESKKHLGLSNYNESLKLLRDMTLENPEELKNTLFLFDHELGNQKELGLNLIEDFNLGTNAILVTGLYFDPSIQARCLKAGCKLLDKKMILSVFSKTNS